MKTRTKLDAIDAVAARLSGRPWNNETCGDIAEILRSAGYTIRDLDENGPCAFGCSPCAGGHGALPGCYQEEHGATTRDHQELGVPAGAQSANPDYPEEFESRPTP